MISKKFPFLSLSLLVGKKNLLDQKFNSNLINASCFFLHREKFETAWRYEINHKLINFIIIIIIFKIYYSKKFLFFFLVFVFTIELFVSLPIRNFVSKHSVANYSIFFDLESSLSVLHTYGCFSTIITIYNVLSFP